MNNLVDRFGTSMTAAHQKTKHFVIAVNHVLSPEPPKREELQQVAINWNSKSHAFGACFGCVRAIDGWLCRINKTRVHNATHHHSGHCQRHGIDVQAVVDANLWFLHFGTAGPGQMNNARAFQNCTKMQEWLNVLPEQHFLIGDHACPLSQRMLIPFSRALEHITFNQSCNFHLGQLWICVKMALSLLTKKWRMSRRNLDAKDPECASSICRAAAKLHNCILENDGSATTFDKTTFHRADFGVKNLPNHDKGHLNTLLTGATQRMVEKDQQRASILAEIGTMQLQCPIDDVLQNCNEELDDVSIVDGTVVKDS